jgi:hypothetical protein
MVHGASVAFGSLVLAAALTAGLVHSGTAQAEDFSSAGVMTTGAQIVAAADVETVTTTGETTEAESATGFLAPLELNGRWTGSGAVKPVRQAEQPFKCVATYFPGKATQRLKQNLRCQNAEYKLDVATLMQIKGNKITGTWQEKTYALTGNLSGDVVDGRMDVHLAGDFFEADMTIVNTGCQQEVIVTPVKAEQIEYLTATLKKC